MLPKNKRTFISQVLNRLQSNERGTVEVIFALSIIPLMVLAGIAVDTSQAYVVKPRLSHSLDAPALDVGSMRSANPDPTYLATQFSNFVAANYSNTDIGATHDLTFIDNGGIINVSGKATVDTVFMAIVGINSITVSSSSQIIVETNGLELALVLDNTGSMGSNGKMTDMKSAAQELINIVFGTETAPPLLKVALVPFDNTVNIGTANTSFVTDPTAFNSGSSAWGGRVMARPYPADVQDTSTTVDGVWTPFWNAKKSSNRNKYCPRPITALTNNRATLVSEINAMSSLGSTHINLGAMWGWRALSPDAPFTQGATYADPDWNKAAIILTDGDNTMIDSYYSAYGVLTDGNLGTTNKNSAENELDSRLLETCTGMKDAGIIVYTIAFGTSIASSTASMLSSCATSPNNYYESPDAATLTLAFRASREEHKNLHLSR